MISVISNRSKNKRRLIISGAILLIMIYILYSIDYRTISENCFAVHFPEPSKTLEDIQHSLKQPINGNNIFFHETSCSENGVIGLNARQACAVESAARMNPTRQTFVLFAAPVGFRNKSSLPLMDALLSYPNVELRFVNLTTYAQDTPLKDWMQSGEIFRSKYMNSHLSDVMRYLTLYKYGGTYLDLDVVVMQSFDTLKPNYAGAESPRWVAAGVIHFELDGYGHELAEMCLRDLLINFNGQSWGNNGPGVITRVFKRVCSTNAPLLMTRERCRHFTVFPPEAFYAINFEDYLQFFEERWLDQALTALNRSVVAHVWNKFSRDHKVRVGSQVAYGVLAERYCPRVYQASGEFF
ncbi:lactosylceramide 4-alpha-galactosyltransferase [Topomyia yanbarensis]|uniref:lactosylceramide 4-alpha-galactosyltransferase n=1 Tax=Topomyia yanbarensis TaxID=2498891 RepID=UPI00273CC892|nr:lactosylceramide 4-alpha-galactosyltransferase [Topomyia yanbarensis]XP_058824633.1 lactosylceramide 4-alpha-galactosyltransferase [Topomyia yanbarensis]